MFKLGVLSLPYKPNVDDQSLTYMSKHGVLSMPFEPNVDGQLLNV